MKYKHSLVVMISGMLAASVNAQANETPLGQLTAKNAPELPLQVIVSRKDQTLRVFKGTEIIATSRVSTGKRGHTTPTGIFSILEKRKRHFSNLYNSAPMPYMQRLTWSGIALHESKSVPSYPASHGCVRLPNGFAKTLFGLTERGAHVIIANREASPKAVSHALLFQPAGPQVNAKFTMLRPTISDTPNHFGKIGLLDSKPVSDPITQTSTKHFKLIQRAKKNGAPIRIFITRQSQANMVREVQAMLNKLGFEAGDVDGLAGKDTFAAIRRFKQSRKGSIDARMASISTRINRTLLQQLYYAAGKGAVPTGHLFVRQKFKPIFDAPIHIRDTQKPLGAHLITAKPSSTKANQLEWLSVSLQDTLSETQQNSLGLKQRDSLASKSEAASMAAILDRIEIPQDVRDQIAYLVSNGSSIAISDKGMSKETGAGTDFIVLTKPNRVKKSKSKSATKPKKRVKRNNRAATQNSTPKKQRLVSRTARVNGIAALLR